MNTDSTSKRPPRMSANTNRPRRMSAAQNAAKPNTTKKAGRKKRKPLTKKKKLMILFTSLGILLFLSVGCILAAKYVIPLYKAATGLNRDTSFDENDVPDNFGNDSEAAAHMEGFINIAVFGIDTRAKNEGDGTQINDSDSRSDVIMIVSVNTDTKEVRLLSVYRDTYLLKESTSKGNTFDKAAHAYAKGKAATALGVLNQNLDLDITDYVTVDFSIVAQAIDAVGGVEIELEQKEIEKFNKNGSYATTYPLLNHYIDEINELTGSDSEHITKAGTYLMDGVQATAFGRIRYCDTDYERTARQREVLMKLFEKAKTQGISKLLQIAAMVTPQVVTSLSASEITDLAKYALNCNIVDQQGFPFNQVSGKLSGTDYVFSENLASDVSQLHYYLFGKENYTPTSKVQEISDEIDQKRGVKKSTGTSTKAPSTTKNPATKAPAATSSSNSSHTDSETSSDTSSNSSQNTTTFSTTVTTTPQQTQEPIETQAPVQTPQPTVAPTPTPKPTVAPTPTIAPTPNTEGGNDNNSASVE